MLKNTGILNILRTKTSKSNTWELIQYAYL